MGIDRNINLIKSFILAMEANDKYTQGHCIRVPLYAIDIYRKMPNSNGLEKTLKYSGILHDLGKLIIWKSILQKPSKLEEEEYAIVKEHPVIGEKMVKSLGLLRKESKIIRHHHERYDGKGFPDKLKGEEIPLAARILAAADSFDAMTSQRPYRGPMSLNQAIAELNTGAGGQFDPAVINAFFGIPHSRLKDIISVESNRIDHLLESL